MENGHNAGRIWIPSTKKRRGSVKNLTFQAWILIINTIEPIIRKGSNICNKLGYSLYGGYSSSPFYDVAKYGFHDISLYASKNI